MCVLCCDLCAVSVAIPIFFTCCNFGFDMLLSQVSVCPLVYVVFPCCLDSQSSDSNDSR